MSLDDQVRRSADALATELGRDIQQALGRFLDQVISDAAQQRDALTDQLRQTAAEADDRVERAVAGARAEAEAERAQALATLRDESAATLSQALAQARAEASGEAARLVARARDEVAEASARLQADEEARRAATEQDALLRQTSEREALLAAQERLVESFRRLDAAPSLTVLLDTLADAAAQESTRSVVFLVRGRELQGWRASGIAAAPADLRRVAIAFEEAPQLAQGVRTKSRAQVAAASLRGALAFLARPGDDDGVGVSVPVIVGGDVAAIVYGDDGGAEGRMVPAVWPETLELLARHAARCLEAQTAIRAARLGAITPGGAVSPPADRRIEKTSAAG
jgi:antitoxin component of RelBE/YafQ-DinJ toxin-antitoxin module